MVLPDVMLTCTGQVFLMKVVKGVLVAYSLLAMADKINMAAKNLGRMHRHVTTYNGLA